MSSNPKPRLALIVLALLLALSGEAWAQTMTCSPTNVSAVAINTSSQTPTVAMPTAAPSGATIGVAIRNRTDSEAPTVSGSVNGSLTVSGGGTNATWIAYLVNASAGTDTFTATFTGLKSTQLIAFWCSDSAGAQTFDTVATIAEASSSTNHDSNSVSAAGAGGIVGALGTSGATNGLTVDGAGETEISGDGAGQRLHLVFEPYASAGSYALEATSTTITNSSFVVLGFLSPGGGGGSTCTGGLMLMGAGKCD